MIALLPPAIRPVAMLATPPAAALKTHMMCTCPAVELTATGQLQELFQNGVPVMFCIWSLMVYAIFKGD